MGHIDRDERARGKAVVPVTTRRPTQPDPSNPFAKFMTERSPQAAKGNIPNKQKNQKLNPPNSSTRPINTNSGGSRGPNYTDIGTANGGSRGPNTHSGTAGGGSRAPDTHIGSGNGGSRAPNTHSGTAGGGSRAPDTHIGSANGGSRGPNTHMGRANGGTVFVDTPLPPSSLLPLRFGSFDSSLPNTSHQTLESIGQFSSPPQTTSPSSPAETSISRSDIPKLQRFIQRVIVAGRLRIKCTKCGNSIQHCCEQAILEAVSSLPPTYFSS